MAARVCEIFHGETKESCWNMTPEELRLWYVQTIIHEARRKIRMINCIRLAFGSSKEVQYAISNIQIQAFPPDPENDPDMDSNSIKQLRQALAASANPV